MTMKTFGAADGNPVTVFTEDLFDRCGLRAVVQGRAGTMRVDIADLFRGDTAFAQALAYTARRLFSCRMGLGHMKGIVGAGMRQDLTINLRATRPRMAVLFQHQDRRSF